MTSIIELAPAKNLPDLLEVLAAGLASLLEPKLMTSLGSGYQFKAENLFNRTATAVEAKFEGEFSPEFLKSVQPFILAALSHPRSKISNRARSMWEITWGKKLPQKNIPLEILSCLKNTGSITDISQSSSSQEPPAAVIMTPTSFRSSFLDRTKLPESPKFAKPSLATKKPPPTKSLFGLEDENSRDFVKISPASKKRRPLTEHQKEKLASRSDDIPALYSEVSRDETSSNRLPPLFDSQMSIDESSMMAMDASDIEVGHVTIIISKIGQPSLSEHGSVGMVKLKPTTWA